MELTPGLRPTGLPGPADPLPESDDALVERIVAEIETTGPMTFARFMELALYDPDGGYYRRPAAGPGRAGDFLTAPEMHPLFGATLARVVADSWRAAGTPEAFALIEYGAGRGALAEPLLTAVAEDEPTLAGAIHYVPLEIDERRLAELRRRLADAGLGDTLSSEPTPSAGIAIANEYLDALPVHLVEGREDGIVELRVAVGSDGGLGFVPGELSTDALAVRLREEGIALADGQLAEICLGIDAWADDLDTRIERGSVVVIDYGAQAPDLYGPARLAGTLMAYAGHRAHDDPFVAIGRQDLTAHVDMTAVQRALETRGWRLEPPTTQARFLIAVGMEETLARFRADAPDIEGQLALRSAAGRLLDPRATGGFRVLTAIRS